MPNLIDLTGAQIGEWTVLGRGPSDSARAVRYQCRCSCGAERLVRAQSLRRAMAGLDNGSRSCGCLHRVEMTGARYGMLTVLGYAAPRRVNRDQVLVLCDCGETKVVWTNHVRRGATRSCGCSKRSDRPAYFTIHKRARYRRGPASDHQCEAPWCTAQAAQWAYLHTDPAELTETLVSRGVERTVYYSTDINRMAALCMRDHVLLDKAVAAWRRRQAA